MIHMCVVYIIHVYIYIYIYIYTTDEIGTHRPPTRTPDNQFRTCDIN